MSLSRQLLNYIKLHGQVHFREIEKYAEEDGYKAYTAVRRLQEIRDPEDAKHYDPTIGTIEENGTIKFYTYKPHLAKAKTTTTNQTTVQKESPRTEAPTLPQQPKYGRSYSVQCCDIWERSQYMHKQGCVNAHS